MSLLPSKCHIVENHVTAQISSSPSVLDQFKPNFMWALWIGGTKVCALMNKFAAAYMVKTL